MSEIVPVNNLEQRLQALMKDKSTPLWSFYTPLAASELWIIVKNHPELDGGDEDGPAVTNPAVCVFDVPDGTCVGLYTSPGRADMAFDVMKIPRGQYIYVSARGYQALKYLASLKADAIWMNAGVVGFQYILDPDMVDILLSRPEPDYEQPKAKVTLDPEDDTAKYLGPLKEFLSTQPNVRAAWVMPETPPQPLPPGARAYMVGLVMKDPDDDSLLKKVGIMAKALTPVDYECTPSLLRGDDLSFQNLARRQPPFYAAPGFLD